MVAYKEVDIDLSFWNSVSICKSVGSREDYSWDDVRAILQSCRSCEEALEYVKRNPLPFFDCHIDFSLSERDRDNIDPVALHYVPADAPEGLVPCTIEGDGNCFPRTLSYICFRKQDLDVEFCVRLQYEALLNAKHYINNRYLSRGSKHCIQERWSLQRNSYVFRPLHSGRRIRCCKNLQTGSLGIVENEHILWIVADGSSS